MMKSAFRRRLAAVAALVSLALGAAGCTVNPATGAQDFTPFMSPAQEAAIGREEHPKLVAAFGGAYQERAELNAYITEIGRRLQRVSEMPELPFTFTVINSDDVNAFALPGGFVHITRGILALANSEAEIAGVLAHEIGHVTARHSAQRYSRGVFTQLGVAILGTATGSRAVGNLAQLGAALYVQGFSREQELEADRLGVRYLGRAGYDPRAMASFLAAMQAESALAAKIAGREGREPTASLFSSHPRTVERVAQAADAARAGAGDGLRIGRDEYLLRLDGTLYGDDPEQGLRRGRLFAHPKLRFRFEVPPGFRMRNTPKAVLATHRSGAVIRFDAGKIGRETAMTAYLAGEWLADLPIEDVEPVEVNGMAAATGGMRANTRQGPRDLRVVAIRFDASRVYRFLILTPPKVTAQLNEGLRRMTFSFRRLSAPEAAALKPLRVRVREVKSGETAASLAAMLPFADLKVERFRALNGLDPGAEPRPGQLVKLVRE